jgi:hypothetical protein
MANEAHSMLTLSGANRAVTLAKDEQLSFVKICSICRNAVRHLTLKLSRSWMGQQSASQDDRLKLKFNARDKVRSVHLD